MLSEWGSTSAPIYNAVLLFGSATLRGGCCASNLHQGAPDMRYNQESFSDGETRLAHTLGVPLADDIERQWPQMGEVVRRREPVAAVEANFEALTLKVGRRLRLGDVVLVESNANYGDSRVYRNVTIGELKEGKAVRVTDYWAEPVAIPDWRREVTASLNMPDDGIWPSTNRLEHH